MKKPSKISLFFPIACATIFFEAQTPKPVWKGTITTENGVKVVHNPAEPLYGTFAFDLQEDLKIGGDPNDAPSYFPKGGSLVVDDAGNIFVADIGNSRVQMFDNSGKFVRTIGRKGQGPGEYMFPGRIFLDPQGNPCVGWGRDVQVYGRDGIFKKKIGLKTFFSYFLMGPGGSFIGSTQPGFGPGGPKSTLVMLDPDGGTARTIAEFRGEYSESQKSLVLHWYSNRIALAAPSSSSFLYGFGEEYKIFQANAEGQTSLIMTRDEKPEPISASEKSETRKNGMYMSIGVSGADRAEAIVFPSYRPYFSWFLSDDAGRLFVIRSGSILEKDAPTPVDIFSKDGIYLYRTTWKPAPAAIKNGAFYEMREDKDTGEYTVVRSKIKNWAAMKSGF